MKTCQKRQKWDPTITGAEVRRLREERGLSLRAFAEKAGTGHMFVHDVEHCRRRVTPKIEYAYYDLLVEKGAGRMEPKEPEIWVCRAIEGDHVGGPECWCGPYVFRAEDDAAINKFIEEKADRPERQVEG